MPHPPSSDLTCYVFMYVKEISNNIHEDYDRIVALLRCCRVIRQLMAKHSSVDLVLKTSFIEAVQKGLCVQLHVYIYSL